MNNLEDQKQGYCNLLQLLELTSNEQETSSPVRPRSESKMGFTCQVEDESMDQMIQLQKEQVN